MGYVLEEYSEWFSLDKTVGVLQIPSKRCQQGFEDNKIVLRRFNIIKREKVKEYRIVKKPMFL